MDSQKGLVWWSERDGIVDEAKSDEPRFNKTEVCVLA
jgi:hypothetical protein